MKGLILPLWVVAAAKSATHLLLGQKSITAQTVDVPQENKSFSLPISSCSSLENGTKAVAITHCDSQAPLDITRGLEVWAHVELREVARLKKNQKENDFPEWLEFIGGDGLAKYENTQQACISDFTRSLLVHNLYPLMPSGVGMRLEVVFPKGKELGMRTSNQAFGIVDGLALIGTQSEVQISSSPDQLKEALESMRSKCADSTFEGYLTFVIGENGLDLAHKFHFPSQSIVKTGNWIGPMIVAAAQEGVTEIGLFGYHGKLIKLAGGIFHTHHHLADGRMEILTALALSEDLPISILKLLDRATSMEDALSLIEDQGSEYAIKIWNRVALEVERRSKKYLSHYLNTSMTIGSILFDRGRNLRWAGPNGKNRLSSLGLKLNLTA